MEGMAKLDLPESYHGVLTCPSPKGSGLLEVSNAPIATEFCLAARFRDVPRAVISLTQKSCGFACVTL